MRRVSIRVVNQTHFCEFLESPTQLLQQITFISGLKLRCAIYLPTIRPISSNRKKFYGQTTGGDQNRELPPRLGALPAFHEILHERLLPVPGVRILQMLTVYRLSAATSRRAFLRRRGTDSVENPKRDTTKQRTCLHYGRNGSVAWKRIL